MCVCPCAHVHVCLRVCCVCVCTHVCVRVCMWARAIFCSIKKRAGGEFRLEISSEAFEKTICRAPTRAPSTRRPAPLAATGPVRRVVLQITIGLRRLHGTLAASRIPGEAEARGAHVLPA